MQNNFFFVSQYQHTKQCQINLSNSIYPKFVTLKPFSNSLIIDARSFNRLLRRHPMTNARAIRRWIDGSETGDAGAEREGLSSEDLQVNALRKNQLFWPLIIYCSTY